MDGPECMVNGAGPLGITGERVGPWVEQNTQDSVVRWRCGWILHFPALGEATWLLSGNEGQWIRGPW